MGIMSGLAALGRVANGFTEGQRMAREDANQAEERDFQRGHRRRMLDQQARDDQLRTELPAALAPVQAQELAGPPADDGTGPGYRVADQNLPTQQAADAAVTTANSPAAVGQRVMAAYTRAGRPTEGLRMRTDMQQASAADAAAADADSARRHRDFLRAGAQALSRGWGELADFATKNYDDGNTYTATENGKGGATITATNRDGKLLRQVELAGPEEAIMYLARRADPVKWVEYKNARADKGRELDLKGQEQDYKARLVNAQIAALNRRDSGGGGLGRMQASDDDKLPPAVKLKYQGYQRELDRLTTAVTNAQAQGGWDPHAPGNASQQALAMRMANLQTEMDALLTPYQPRAASPAGAAAQPGDPMDVRKTLAEKAAAAQTGQGLAGQSATPGNAPPAVPTDETARRVQTRPVIDFTAASGQRRRMTAAQGELPGLEQAVINAQRAVQAAAAQGPMAVARARDELSRARTELQMARDRAGQ